MILTVASFKGGQGKTTTAVHLAGLLQRDKPTLLVDGDPNRSASGWARRKGFPFAVLDEKRALKAARDYGHMVIDTRAHPSEGDLRELAAGCDQLIIPMTPDALSLDTLHLLAEALNGTGGDRYRVLQTIVPPSPSRNHEMMTEALAAGGVPAFRGYVRRYVAFQKAALEGVLVSEVDDRHAEDGWNDYVALAKELEF